MTSSLSSPKPWSRILESQGPVIALFFLHQPLSSVRTELWVYGWNIPQLSPLSAASPIILHHVAVLTQDCCARCQGCKAERNTGPAVLVLVSMFAGWRDGSTVKSSYCSHRGPRFGSQHPSGISKPPITLVPEDLTFPCLCGSTQKLTQAHPHTHTQTHTNEQ